MRALVTGALLGLTRAPAVELGGAGMRSTTTAVPAAFLVSGDAATMTGQTLCPDAGLVFL